MRVHRNHFGRQVESFVADVELPFLARSDGPSPSPFPGVFIRAPVVEHLLAPGDTPGRVAGPGGTARLGDGCGGAAVVTLPPPGRAEVEVLGVLPGRTARVRGSALDTTTEIEKGNDNDIVAVRQGNVMGTSFHPELTDDVRIHVWWLEQVLKTLPSE